MSGSGSNISTSVLWEQIFKASSVEQIYRAGKDDNAIPTFSEYISSLCAKLGELPEHIIKRANIERTYGHAIFRSDRHPSRNTVLQLAFGFNADVELAQSLLKHAGHSQLYPRVPRDAVISYCLYNHISYIDAQRILFELGLPLIGGDRK